ncbi:MAG: HAMP domain-containing protein [Bacteriovoracia bacterium]
MTEENRAGGRHPGRRVRNLLINPRYQLKFIFWMTVLGLVLVILNASVFHLYVQRDFEAFVRISSLPNEVKDTAIAYLNSLGWKLMIWSIVFMVLMCSVALLFSHRTAGPMFQMKKVMEKVRDGEVDTRVHLRKEDDFREVAVVLNEMLDKLVPKRH